jgi:ElaB/YqjD/DUF883 family membrane-anchored ribosome-binding protein
MAPEPDVIRQQIDQTRSALTQKLETLEEQVRGTVHEAKASVEETIESAKTTVEDTLASVKATVQETVETVKQTFNVPRQVRRHPWGMTGGSFVAGFVVGNFAGRPPLFHNGFSASRSEASTRYNGSAPLANQPRSTPEPARPSMWSGLLDHFHQEVDTLRGLAIGTTFGLVRDAAKEAIPGFASQIEQVMNNVTMKLGGQPIEGRVVDVLSGQETEDVAERPVPAAMYR